MAKNYILEPTELSFAINNFRIDSSEPLFDTEALTPDSDVSCELPDGTVLKYAGFNDETFGYAFTLDGVYPSNERAYPSVSYFNDPGEVSLFYYPESADGIVSGSTITISIYTETEDKPYIDEKLSKNITYTDHPHNNWEEVLSKKGDPKTGYNTIEKIANASSEGGSSSGGSGVNFLHTESTIDGATLNVRITDVGPFNNTDEGCNEAAAFVADLATRQTVVYVTPFKNGTVFHCPVIEIEADDCRFTCLSSLSGNSNLLKFEITFDDAGHGYFEAYISK